MKYIQGIIGLELILSIYKYCNIKCYMDEAFLVQKDIRIYTCELMNMVTGGAYVQSILKKLNTESSTEAELVGVDDFMTHVICTRYFLK